MAEIRKIACIGSGLVGHSWATLFALKGYPVVLQDENKSVLRNALDNVKSNLAFLVQKEVVSKKLAGAALERIQETRSISQAVADVQYVQESVFETYEIKKKVFKEMDRASSSEAILASSSSGLMMTKIQEVARRPQRCIVAHPFNPPHLIPLVELVPGKKTAQKTVSITYDFMRRIGKVPVVVKKEVPGYLANRLTSALWREAIDLVYTGVASVEDVDKALTAGPGIRWAIMGPHLTYHLGGGKGGIQYFFDHIGKTKSELWKTMADWTSIPPLARKKVVLGLMRTEILKKKTMEELIKWRDDRLIELIKVLWQERLKPTQVES